MNNDLFTPQELHEAEALDSAIEEMKNGTAPKAGPLHTENRAAMWMHGRVSSAEIDTAFEQRLGKELTRRFGTASTKPRIWARILVPFAGFAVVAVGVFGATYIQHEKKAATESSTAADAQAGDNTSTPNTAAASANTNASNATSSAAHDSANTDAEATNTDDDTFVSIDTQLASVTPELTELTELDTSLQASMDDLDNLLDGIDALDDATSDSSSASSQVEQLSL